MKFNTRVKLTLALLLGRFQQWTICANRFESTSLSSSGHEIKVTFRRTWEPDGYSREELYEMLCLVRKHQRIQEQTPEYIEHIEREAMKEASKQ